MALEEAHFWRGFLRSYSQRYPQPCRYLKVIHFSTLTIKLPRHLSRDSQMPLQSPNWPSAFGFIINSLRHLNPKAHHGGHTSATLRFCESSILLEKLAAHG